MTSKDKLIKYVQNFLTLTDEEVSLFISDFQERKIKKRQFIVQPNFICKDRFFVIKGAFRTYAIADDGQEHTIQFAIENW